jgi:hypothetical protein
MALKKLVSAADIETQAVIELPDRQTLSCGTYLVYINDSFNQSIAVFDVIDFNQALQLCGLVNNFNLQLNFIAAQNSADPQQWWSCQLEQKNTSVVEDSLIGVGDIGGIGN